MSDAYTWIAHYRDGGSVRETDDVSFATVDQSRLATIELHPLVANFAPIVVQIGDEMEGMFFRRRSIEINTTTGEQIASTVTVVGWTWHQCDSLYLWIYPDGSIKATERDDG
jgi:hypothetical protein